MPLNGASNDRKPPSAVVFPPDPNETGAQVVDRIFRSFGLDEAFPDSCQKHVDEIVQKDPTKELVGGQPLEDYTDKPFITIDNDDSMDLDQAMWITRSSDERILVSYALADGAYFVPAMSPLFEIALSRGGSSFYLPGKCIPMLPRVLSEDLMSLNENVPRRALIFDIYLNKDGTVHKSDYCWGIIRSRWKGSYRKVSEYYKAIDSGDHHPLESSEFRVTLDLLREVGILRRKQASERNVVDYLHRDDESRIRLTKDGSKLIFSKSVPRYDSELYNEQISLLCNSEGAKILDQMDTMEAHSGKDIVHPIYRTQSSPRDEQVDVLELVIQNTLGANGLDVNQWRWDRSNEPIAAYLTRLKVELKNQEGGSSMHRQWSAVLRVIERQAMITNVAASFATTPGEGHHSLKMTHYARFSSPMREAVGCFTHKELLEGHVGSFITSNLDSDSDIALRNRVIRVARRAKELQKSLSSALFLHMLNVTFYSQLHHRFPKRTAYQGIIMGMNFSDRRNKSRRCYVQLDDPVIEIKVFGEDLDFYYGCRYDVVGRTAGLEGTSVAIEPKQGSYPDDADKSVPPSFMAGQRVSVKVSDYAQYYSQTSRSRWIFILEPIDMNTSIPR